MDVVTEILSTETMMAPIGAGVLALLCCEGDTERMLLHVLQGHCNSPIAEFARIGRSGELVSMTSQRISL
jgi:hydroxymethylbilane synthase